MAALEKLQARETENSLPLTRANIETLVPTTVWLHQPGIHLGILSERGKDTLAIVFVVKIQSVRSCNPCHLPLITNPVPGKAWNP
jgi:hypothetical protein